MTKTAIPGANGPDQPEMAAGSSAFPPAFAPGCPRLAVTGLECHRGDFSVFAGLDLSAGPGEVILLRGPNGAGKSTLLGALAGLFRPFSGQIDWLDRDPEIPLTHYLHMLGHLSAVKPSLTVSENLGFWKTLYGGTGDPDEAAFAAGLDGLEDIEAGVLSQGQTRRLGLARLLVAARPVWLLDEPTAGLDAAGEAWVAGLIARQIGMGGLVIAATHLPIDLPGTAKVTTLTLAGRQIQ